MVYTGYMLEGEMQQFCAAAQKTHAPNSLQAAVFIWYGIRAYSTHFRTAMGKLLIGGQKFGKTLYRSLVLCVS